jgi:Fe-S cluster assembly protein SufD
VASDGDVFTAFNATNIRDGAFIHVDKNTSVKDPLMITHVQTQPGTTATWRSLIVVEAGANATVVEQFLSADPELDACTIPVTEIILGEGATLKYLCAQTLSEQTWLFGSQRAELARDSHLHWVGLGLGSRRGKLRMETDLRGQGSRAVVTGAYVTEHEQHLDYETTQEHYAPNTSSDLSFRGILKDHAHSVWSGMIRVDPGAQKTDAFQESRNLLLSPNAHADSIPGLEIEADDVRCTHAATISQVDENQLFYLESRGLPRAEAEAMIISGFLETTVTRLEDWGSLQRPVRLALTQALQKEKGVALLGSD